MDAPTAFIHLAIIALSIAAVVVAVCIAAKIISILFPAFAARLTSTYDSLMGTDEEYDRKYQTGYAPIHVPARWK